MGYAIAVNQSNFQAEVVQNSFDKPVVVDFYATWCGPCQLLKPILEKLVPEYDFILAKIDIDENPELAKYFRVEGVPDVRIAHLGKLEAGFVGALPEADIRQLLTQYGLQSSLELGLTQLQEAIAAGNYPEAKQLLDQLFSQYPDEAGIAIAAAKFLLTLGQTEDVEKILATINPKEQPYYLQGEAIRTLLKLQAQIQQKEDTKTAQNFQTALNYTLANNYAEALPLWLELVKTDRKYCDDGARKAMVAIFHLLGNADPLTKSYQQQLLNLLY